MGKTDRAYNAKSAIHTFKQSPNMAAVYPCDWQLPIKIGTKSMGKRVSLLKRRIQGFRFNVQRTPYTADFQWNRFSNLEPSGPEAETLLLGHCGLEHFAEFSVYSKFPEIKTEVSPN
ncbi:hypothetical protein AVEN_33508-1 [Araneus ventricosus]|uniref:Uncharacterized protein n=1 Tax=Araneus ventricosus TaxID=182803 RepID=A0A4Y2L5H8_ARAVE|nr:hypothetical protein AVEN_33508-1 [Araneus ventricosus]